MLAQKRRNLLVISLIMAISFLIFSVLRVPPRERETSLLSAIAGALAVVSGIGITVFLIVAQIYSPYYSGLRTLITKPILIYLGMLGIGILLPLAVLHGSSIRWLTGEPLHFLGIFEISWTHLCFAWFAACLIVLPWFLQYAQKLVGPRGVIMRAEASLLGSASALDFESVNDNLHTLYHVALTAVERREIAVMHLALESLGKLLWRSDATCKSDAQLEGRANVILHGLSILPPPAGQEDLWRLTYRQLRLLHIAICGSGCSHLILEECSCVSMFCVQALREDQNSSIISIAVISIFAEALDQGVVAGQPEVIMVATTEIERLAQEAVRLGTPKTPRQVNRRRYLFLSARLAIKSIRNAFLSESGELRLTADRQSATWSAAIGRVIGSLRNIAQAALDKSLITSGLRWSDYSEIYKKMRERLSCEDDLTQSQLQKIMKEAIISLSSLRRQLDKFKWHRPAKEAASTVGHLGIMAVYFGWISAATTAIADQEDAARTWISDDIRASRNSFNSIKNIGLSAAVLAINDKIMLRALTALTVIARNAIASSLEDLALEIVGGENSVVTILGICHHKLGHPKSSDAKKKSLIVQENLQWIKVHCGANFSLQFKAEQALYELNCWIA